MSLTSLDNALPQGLESDADLVEKIRYGETEAEATIYEKYAARVYYLGLSELRSHAEAEDVRAETFLRALQAIRAGRLRSPQALASFILGTAHNVIRESLKHGRRTEQLAEQETEEGGSYSQEFLDSNVELAIERVIRRLKPREQKFLRLYYYEELPKEEIARRLGVKEERLRLLKSRALKRFREIYERLMK